MDNENEKMEQNTEENGFIMENLEPDKEAEDALVKDEAENEEIIDKIIELPLRKACKVFKEKGIETYFYKGVNAVGNTYRADGISELIGSGYAGIINAKLQIINVPFILFSLLQFASL